MGSTGSYTAGNLVLLDLLHHLVPPSTTCGKFSVSPGMDDHRPCSLCLNSSSDGELLHQKQLLFHFGTTCLFFHALIYLFIHSFMGFVAAVVF